jgi:hypothetical protein
MLKHTTVYAIVEDTDGPKFVLCGVATKYPDGSTVVELINAPCVTSFLIGDLPEGQGLP